MISLFSHAAIRNCLFFTLLLPASAVGQNNKNDSNISIASYSAAVHEQQPVFYGSEYVRTVLPISKGSIFFHSNQVSSGNVRYAGRYFQNIPLIYDQLADELCTRPIQGMSLLRLFTPKVDSFSLHGARFVRVDVNQEGLRSGYWQVTHEGACMLLEKELKKIVEVLQVASPYSVIIDSKTIHLVKIGDTYQRISRKSDLANVFQEERESIQSYLKSNRRKFRKLPLREALQAVAIHYESLKEKR